MSLGCAPSQCRVYIARMYLVVSMCIHFSTAVRAQAERVLNEWVLLLMDLCLMHVDTKSKSSKPKDNGKPSK